MKNLILFITLILVSCSRNHKQGDRLNSDNLQNQIDTIRIVEYKTDTVFVEKVTHDRFYIIERLPYWFVKTDILNEDLLLKGEYKFDDRLNPLYLEEDFNVDGEMDIALPIYNKNNGKKGIAIIHGQTNNVSILGAGKKYKNGHSDDINWFNIWFVNRNKINPQGVDATEPLRLKNPSIQIEKSVVGGGQLFWNGKEYEYFHQIC